MSKYYIAQIDDRIAHEGVWDDYTYWFDGTLASAGHYEEIPYQTFKLLDEDTFLNDLTTKGRL